MNTKIILSVVITIMACVIIFLLYDSSRKTAPEPIPEFQVPISNTVVPEHSSNSSPSESPSIEHDQAKDMQSQASSQAAHTHNWVNCSKCDGKGVGFYGDEGYSYCKECRGQKMVCSTCGARDDRPQPCIACKGSKSCAWCKGMGFTYDEFVGEIQCYHCEGTGKCDCVRKGYN